MNNNKLFFILLIVGFLASCSEAYIDREPAGGVIRQDQYEQLNSTVDATMRGVYSLLYKYSGHDSFGERSADMYGDILCGDMALTAYAYGWFYCDENGESNTDRSGYLWGHYYTMLHNVNCLINLINVQSDVVERISKNGTPNIYNTRASKFYTIQGSDTLATFTETEARIAGVYAQALTIRGYIIQQLLFYYCFTTEQALHHSGGKYTWDNYPTFPLYTEKTVDTNLGYAHLRDTYAQEESDLLTAIDYFTAFAPVLTRANKLAVDASIARAFLAYSYLNKADSEASPSSDDYKIPYTEALRLAEEIIASGQYTLLPQSRVLTSGFNDINESSWMWGQTVTTETATGLGSFFGQVDIHSYSYAWAGDTKVIDKNLYNQIYSWDIRRLWFNDGVQNSTFLLCPDKKFFSASCPTSTKAEDIDREWLSDNVYMRYESIYLIAAEAAYRLGQYDKAKSYLTAITDIRINENNLTAAADYATWKGDLTSANLLSAIIYNWRIELWGEGYGLQTFRRLTKAVRRGANHLCNPGKEEEYDNGNYLIIIPSNEYLYNPEL